jgi:hypothetical protein
LKVDKREKLKVENLENIGKNILQKAVQNVQNVPAVAGVESGKREK